ncbi:MAG: SRPBCC family protein, partial [Pseudonocardiaceae bacterium]
MSERRETKIVAKPGAQQILVSRVFDAPREAVFRAYTDPLLLPGWWGPAGMSTTVEQMELRVGGQWRYVCSDAEGNSYTFRGVYHDVAAPERLTHTFEFEDVPGGVLLETVGFEDLGDATRLTDITVFQTLEDRDDVVQAGMEQGVVET